MSDVADQRQHGKSPLSLMQMTRCAKLHRKHAYYHSGLAFNLKFLSASDEFVFLDQTCRSNPGVVLLATR
jgi:hypothetical protein